MDNLTKLLQESRALLALTLKKRFPWLGTEEEANGSAVVESLTSWYASLMSEEGFPTKKATLDAMAAMEEDEEEEGGDGSGRGDDLSLVFDSTALRFRAPMEEPSYYESAMSRKTGVSIEQLRKEHQEANNAAASALRESLPSLPKMSKSMAVKLIKQNQPGIVARLVAGTGEIRVNKRGNPEATAYYTVSAEDAIETAVMMEREERKRS